MKLLNKKNILWILAKNLSNLNFALFILFIIILFSMLGSIIEQDQSLRYYQTNYPIITGQLFEFNWQFILHFGFDHLFQTWWFLGILILFCLSLSICTFSIQLPSLKNARRWKFLNVSSNLKNKKVTFFKANTSNSFINIIYELSYHNYYIFNKKSNIYAYKGIIGRIAPIFVHASIIITLFGSTIGGLSGFISQEMIPSNEIFHIKNVFESGFQNKIPFNFIFHIDDFYISYNIDKSIKQFFSQVSILNNQSKTLLTQTISVNSPLIFKGITFYQTDWQINALRIKIGSDFFIQCKLNKIQLNNNAYWICRFPINNNTSIFILVLDLNDNILIYNSLGEIIEKVSINQKLSIDNSFFIITEIMTSTGLQIKVDPGIKIVYLGFGILILSTFMSYASYSQIWINLNINNFELFGSTNRAILKFEEECMTIQNSYLNSMN
uniref:Cytochrome c biogenesis protein CcsB n=1 Tax=Antithamnion hubbsii TaxID=1005974 RepID=A0A4D6WLD3_9FLOR|nr:cytochrome c biogenesis protein ccs1 [Antithamnion hubbsii]